MHLLSERKNDFTFRVRKNHVNLVANIIAYKMLHIYKCHPFFVNLGL